MTENQKQTSGSNEIDLGVLFSKIGSFIKDMGFGFVRFLAFLRRIPIQNKTLFIVLIIAGVAGGISYSVYFKKKFYSTTMILSSEYLNNRLIEITLRKLNQLADEKDGKGLANVLQISDDLAVNIHNLEARPFIPESELIDLEVLKKQLKELHPNKEDKESEKRDKEKIIQQVINHIKIENSHSYEITVTVYNPTVVYDLEKALVSYFRNNTYIKKRIEISKSNKLAKKQKLVWDSQKLDSLKSVIYSTYLNMAGKSRQGSNNVILSEKSSTNPVVEIFDLDIELYDEMQAIDQSLYLQDDFEVVSGFTEYSKPSSDGPVKTSAYAVLITIGVGYLLVGLIRFNKYLETIA